MLVSASGSRRKMSSCKYLNWDEKTRWCNNCFSPNVNYYILALTDLTRTQTSAFHQFHISSVAGAVINVMMLLGLTSMPEHVSHRWQNK